jgi:hypothetical protein
MKRTIFFRWTFIFAFLSVPLGCGEKEPIIREKLEYVCKSDLDSIVVDLPKTSLADPVYYSIISYKTYEEGKYSKMAVVEFYFLKKVKAKIVRKYRYFKEARMWDRYFNEYSFINDTTNSAHR